MSDVEEEKFEIKLVVNKKRSKVLFAEAGGDFTDVLLTYLVLPLSNVVQVLEKRYGDEALVIGSVNTLYKGASNLDIAHFRRVCDKTNLIRPTLFERELAIAGLNRPNSTFGYGYGQSYERVFADGSSSFIITDDLRVFPIVKGSIIQTLITIGISIQDMDDAETKNVTFGFNEIIALMKESLISSNPLTALVCPSRRMLVATMGQVKIDQVAKIMNSKNMSLKVMLQKSTNKFLFAQADRDFVDFLFSILILSLERLGSTGMSRFQKSATPNFENMHLKRYKSFLTQYNYTDRQYYGRYDYVKRSTYTGLYVKGSMMYMVRDDLTVSPLEVTSGVCVIKELNVSLSDIKEVEMQVGLEEGLSILKVALTSTTALTNGLISPFFEKQEKDIKPVVKQEME